MKPTIKKILTKLSDKVELKNSVTRLLQYKKDVAVKSKTLLSKIKEYRSVQNEIENERKELLRDMGELAKGIEAADSAAKLLGISPNEIPNYREGLQAIKIALELESEAKRIIS
jgi:poly-D-alanine transfer protein DltD